MKSDPNDPVQVKVASVWTQLVHGPPARQDTNFFIVGGNSFLAAVLLESLNGHFGVRVTLREFLADPSVQGVTAAIKAAVPPSTSTAGP